MSWVVGLLVSITLLISCSPAAKKMDAPEPEGDIISRDGFYQDKKVGFSFAWPAEVFTVKDELQEGNGEVVRVKHSANIPVITIAVGPKTAKTPALEGAAKAFKDGLKASQKGSKRFKLRDNKIVTLANGVKASYAMVTWKYGGSFGLVTVGLTVNKGNDVIIISITSAPGQPAVEVLDKWLMALKVDP